jgi:dTDP-4-amino-4,6-dideoxygalactose transaminase
VELDTLCLDPRDVERRITRRTRAVLALHYGGMCGNFQALRDLCRSKRLFLVEDAALALGATWRDRPLGSFGDLSCFSFHSTKPITCGEGGALATPNARLARRLEVLRSMGTDREDFLRGVRSRYVWQALGSNFSLPSLLSGMLEEQVRRFPAILSRDRRLWDAYARGLAPLEEEGLVRLAHPASDVRGNGGLFWLLLDGPWANRRSRVVRSLASRGIPARSHYEPLHSSPYALRHYGESSLPVTERVGRDLLRLPLHPGLALRDVARICRAVQEVLSPRG